MDIVVIFKSLADETRLSIVRHLRTSAGEEMSCSEIVGDCSLALNLSQPTMSHHFKMLVQAGVLYEHKVGTEKYYRLNRKLLKSVGIDVAKI